MLKRSENGSSFALETLEGRRLLSAVKIMPLGASLTEASVGHAGYRFFLWNQLKLAGYSDVDFVGGRSGVSGGSPLYSNFDQDHEGHSGFRADEIAENVAAWATANPPDVVLLHAGTNDILQNQSVESTADDLRAVIDNLRTVVPGVTVIISQVIPGITYPDQYPLLNELIAVLASEKSTEASRVIAVDQYSGIDPANDLYDGVHPNESGERKVAGQFFTALQNILPAPAPQPGVTYLSDLTPVSSTNGWGPLEGDRSNGETGAADGHALALNGIGYLKGLGAHASADVSYNIAGAGYREFTADIGIDDESGSGGSVVFRVLVDGVTQYVSPKMTGASTTVRVRIPLAASASNVRLVASDSGDGNAFDHADWADARFTVAQGAADEVYLSDQPFTLSSNGWGPVERDRSNGETGANDGRTIRLNGQAYAKGLGVHAASDISVSLNNQYSRFVSDIGVDDEKGNGGSVVFIAYVDGLKVYDSGMMTGTSATKSVSLNLAGASTLRLVVTNGGNGNDNDHADWAGAKLVRFGSPVTPPTIPPPPPPPPNDPVYLSDLTPTTATNGWGPIEKDRSNGESQAGDGKSISIAGKTFAKGIGVHANSQIIYALDGKYAKFLAEVGIDAEVGNRGGVVFQVYLDGIKAFDSGLLVGGAAGKVIDLDITGKSTLRLLVTDGGNGINFDHADWADARLLRNALPV